MTKDTEVKIFIIFLSLLYLSMFFVPVPESSRHKSICIFSKGVLIGECPK